MKIIQIVVYGTDRFEYVFGLDSKGNVYRSEPSKTINKAKWKLFIAKNSVDDRKK